MKRILLKKQDLEEIANENFDVFSRQKGNDEDLFLSNWDDEG